MKAMVTGMFEKVEILLRLKMSINRKIIRNKANETLLFVRTRDAPSPNDAYLGSDKVGRLVEDGNCVGKGSRQQRDENRLTKTTLATSDDDDCSFRPLLLTTGQLGEGGDVRRSTKVMKVVGDGGWSIPSGTGEQ